MTTFKSMTFVAALSIATPLCAATLTGHQYLNETKVSLETARHIALKTYPGKIVSQELERERGGSGLRYSFDVRNGKTFHEVGVDARTGAVLENSVEGPHAD